MLASIWLQPVGEARDTLQQLITELAAEHGTPSFAPHLTVCGGADLDPTRWEEAAAWLRHSPMLPLTGRRTGISYSTTVPFRAMTVDIEDTLEISAFREEMCRLTGAAIIAHPHISLLYTLDSTGQRTPWAADEQRLQAIAEDCARRLPITEFVLGDAVVVAPDGLWDNVPSWRVVRRL